MKYIPINKDIIDIYYRFIDQTEVLEKGFELIQSFIQTILSNLDNADYLFNEQIWKGLMLLHS